MRREPAGGDRPKAPAEDRLNRMFELLTSSFPRPAAMDSAISDIRRPMVTVIPGVWVRPALCAFLALVTLILWRLACAFDLKRF